MTKYTIGQELVIAPNGYAAPVVLTVTKVGTKYVTADAKNGTRWTIIKATGLTAHGDRAWPSRKSFAEEASRAGRIKDIRAMIGKFEWSKCSLAKLDSIEAAFREDERSVGLKAKMRAVGMT